MFSQPHCSVELLGALHRFTVMGPVTASLVAYSVFSSLCPERMMLVSAPCGSSMAPEGAVARRAAAAAADAGRVRAPPAPAAALEGDAAAAAAIAAAAVADAGLGRGDESGLPEYFEATLSGNSVHFLALNKNARKESLSSIHCNCASILEEWTFSPCARVSRIYRLVGRLFAPKFLLYACSTWKLEASAVKLLSYPFRFVTN